MLACFPTPFRLCAKVERMQALCSVDSKFLAWLCNLRADEDTFVCRNLRHSPLS